MIKIIYVLGPGARRAIAKATGALSIPETRCREEDRNFVPQKGDVITWAAIGDDVPFVVENRLFKIDVDGQMDVELHIESYDPGEH